MFIYAITTEHTFDMRKHMKENGVTLREVAKYTRFEFTYLSKLNTGRYKTDEKTFIEIQKAVFLARTNKNHE